MLLDELAVGIDEFLQERFHRVAQLARFVKRSARTAQIGFWLLQSVNIEENKGLAQVLVGAETADGAW